MLDIANVKFIDPTNPFHRRAEKKDTTVTIILNSTVNFSFHSKVNEKDSL